MSSTSSMLSRLWLSLPVMDTSGSTSERFGNTGERRMGPRATAQLRLPEIVLISPLCASKRNGCAKRHCGKVLVEKRWWKTATEVSMRGSRRSGKNSGRCAGMTMPL